MTDEKIKNSSELEFAIFCIENVAAKLGVNAERVYQAFTERAIFWTATLYQNMKCCIPRAANLILLQKKYSRVIKCFAKQRGLLLEAALDFFYDFQVYQLIRDGVSDMHCMSDAYLEEKLKLEYVENNVK